MSGLSLVTGANGHVGYNLVRALSARGMPVRATVRNAGDPAKAGFLSLLPNVEVVSLDVRDGAAFDQAAHGVETLYHVAATYKLYAGGADAEAEMVRDSVEGATAALRSAARNGVSRVVLTSSCVTLPFVRAGAPFPTETDWQEEFTVPYFKAKTLGEREAWRLADELGVSLVTVLPGMILGPPFLRRTTSLDILLGIMKGVLRFGAPDAHIPIPVDVRDVADAHLLAAQSKLGGRFIIAYDRTYSYAELSRIMHQIDKAVPAAPIVLPKFLLRFMSAIDWFNAKAYGAPRVYTSEAGVMSMGRQNVGSNARARRELAWSPKIPFEQSLAETMVALRQ